MIFDIFQFDNQLINQTRQLNSTDMWYQNKQWDYQHVAGPICKDPDQYFYYDRIHTTDTVNKLLAEELYR